MSFEITRSVPFFSLIITLQRIHFIPNPSKFNFQQKTFGLIFTYKLYLLFNDFNISEKCVMRTKGCIAMFPLDIDIFREFIWGSGSIELKYYKTFRSIFYWKTN